MYQCECQKIDACKLWCWRRLLRVPLTARSNQSILKEINLEYSLEGLMLKQKLQYFGHLMRRANSLVKTLMLGKIEDRRRRGQQKIKWLDGITNSMNKFEQTPGDSAGQGSLVCCISRGCKELDTAWRLNNNTVRESFLFPSASLESRFFLYSVGYHVVS